MADQFNILDRPAGVMPWKTGNAAFRMFPLMSGLSTTSNSLGNGTLRLSPIWVPNPVTVSHVGAEVLATVGEAGSVLRLGLYRDNGLTYPGDLLLDAGTIPGDAAAVVEIDITDLLLPSGLYWGGGVVQSAPTTQPNVRGVSLGVPGLVTAAAVGAAGVLVGYSQGGVTGALPATFSTTVANAGVVPRIHFRLAA